MQGHAGQRYNLTVVESPRNHLRSGQKLNEYARGYADGGATRERGLRAPSYLGVSRDEYATGFRAGYYEKDRRTGRTADFEAKTQNAL
jgi:hypothetical protein